jgi:hypothetical protein
LTSFLLERKMTCEVGLAPFRILTIHSPGLLERCAPQESRYGLCLQRAGAGEIARSDKRTRVLTSDQVKADIELIAGLLPGKDKRKARSRAILTFSALVGAMSLARAVSDEALSNEILKTVADLLKHPS